MKPFFSILTPTLQRESLVKCCQSVDEQTFASWEHWVFIDEAEIDMKLIDRTSREDRRTFMHMKRAFVDGGNTPRREVWERATGEWVIYLDDDNFLADSTVLERIANTIRDSEVRVHFFPITRFGNNFFPPDPPRSCHVDTANCVCKREIGQWPDTNAYGSDGIWIEALVKNYRYAMHGHEAPIVIMPKMGGCQK